LVVALVGTAIAVYSSDYVIHVGGPYRQAALLVLFNLALGSLAAIVVAGNALTFLLAWEAMSILTYALVALEYDHPEAPAAAFLMLALSELGFVSMAVGFAIVGAFEPGRTFASLASTIDGNRDAGFLLFLFGFGAKAGLVPLQGWLPEAHPAAPSNVSALLSAVVVKMAVYGLILTTVVLLGEPPLWWGYVALVAGVGTAIYGVLFSLLAHDLKRALAFSTVENLGFIVALIGAALLFRGFGNPLLEGLALAAVGLHVLNHALLKATLFLAAGSVQVATGLRDMDALGGLWKRMRWTSICFFVGAAGLAGIPPLNGFQSEWLGLQVLLQSHLLKESNRPDDARWGWCPDGAHARPGGYDLHPDDRRRVLGRCSDKGSGTSLRGAADHAAGDGRFWPQGRSFSRCCHRLALASPARLPRRSPSSRDCSMPSCLPSSRTLSAIRCW